jgi:hypothetical protein
MKTGYRTAPVEFSIGAEKTKNFLGELERKFPQSRKRQPLAHT